MMIYSTLAAAQDPWVPYDTQYNKGKGKGHPIIPEISPFWMVGACLLFVFLARWDNRKRH